MSSLALTLYPSLINDWGLAGPSEKKKTGLSKENGEPLSERRHAKEQPRVTLPQVMLERHGLLY
jgi:hypothetical protein